MTIKTTAALSSRAIFAIIVTAIEGVAKSSWVFRAGLFNGNSDQKTEEYIINSMVPQFQKWIGSRGVKNLEAGSIEVTNEKYEATVTDFVDNWRFDKSGMRSRVVGNFGRRSMTHWEKLLVTLLAAGESLLSYDGVAFFSASHTQGDSGTQSNLLTVTDYANLNVSVAAAPTPYEMSLALNDVIHHFYTYLDDVGEPLQEDAMEFTVFAPVKIASAAAVAASKDNVNTGSGVEENVLKNAAFKINVVPSPRLTGAVFYVFRSDGGGIPAFVLQEKQPGVELSAKAEGSDYEHDTDMWEFGAKANRAAALFGWCSAIKATLS